MLLANDPPKVMLEDLRNSKVPELGKIMRILVCEAFGVFIRDGNLNPIRGYPARSDPNGPDFTRSDKE